MEAPQALPIRRPATVGPEDVAGRRPSGRFAPRLPSADSEGRWPAKAGQRVPRSAAVSDHPSEGRGSEPGHSAFERSENRSAGGGESGSTAGSVS